MSSDRPSGVKIRFRNASARPGKVASGRPVAVSQIETGAGSPSRERSDIAVASRVPSGEKDTSRYESDRPFRQTIG